MKQVNRFEMVPTGNVPRTKMTILSGHKTSINAGKLTPVYADIDVLPHQTKKLSVDFVLRGTTFKTPIMDYFFIDFFAFYTCNRILLDSWVEIMGENKTGVWAQSTRNLFVPEMNFAGQPVTKGNLANYFGIPIGYTGKISLLPFRNYQLIWNEWFRDQNVVAPIQISRDSNQKTPADFNNLELLPVYKIADYFTTALPEPQKGLAVTTPLGESAPIIINPDEHSKGVITRAPNGSTPDLYANIGSFPDSNLPAGNTGLSSPGGGLIKFDPNNTLIADLSEAVGATINAQRLAWQIQGILQMDARGGTRYFEICKNHFKVRIPDNQWRPELIGSKRIPININQVVQNSESGTTPLGTTGAFCHVSGHVEFPTKSFVEHGEYFILACIRQQHTYQQGIAKPWFKRQRFDFYLPALAHLGEQPIYQREIFATGNDNEDWKTYGFAEAWSEYRYKPSIVTGELSSLYDQPLDIWHLGDYYEDAPVLSDEFLRETPEYLDRCIQIPSSTQDQFIIDMLFTDDCVLPMPMYSVPSMVDHF